jgi:hypothetical protein
MSLLRAGLVSVRRSQDAAGFDEGPLRVLAGRFAVDIFEFAERLFIVERRFERMRMNEESKFGQRWRTYLLAEAKNAWYAGFRKWRLEMWPIAMRNILAYAVNDMHRMEVVCKQWKKLIRDNLEYLLKVDTKKNRELLARFNGDQHLLQEEKTFAQRLFTANRAAPGNLTTYRPLCACGLPMAERVQPECFVYLCANGVNGCGAIRYEKAPAMVEIRNLDLAPPAPKQMERRKTKKKKTLKQKTGGSLLESQSSEAIESSQASIAQLPRDPVFEEKMRKKELVKSLDVEFGLPPLEPFPTTQYPNLFVPAAEPPREPVAIIFRRKNVARPTTLEIPDYLLPPDSPKSPGGSSLDPRKRKSRKATRSPSPSSPSAPSEAGQRATTAPALPGQLTGTLVDLPDLEPEPPRPSSTPFEGRRRFGFAKPKPRRGSPFKSRDLSSVMRHEQKVALRRDEKFVDMNIKRLKAEDRLFRERMKTDSSDVSELMARYALAKGEAKRERKPLSPLHGTGGQSLSMTQSVRKLNATLRGEENVGASRQTFSALKGLSATD